MSQIRYVNKGEIPPIPVSFGVPEVFDEHAMPVVHSDLGSVQYIVASDPAVDTHGEDGWYRRVEVAPRRFHAPSLMLVLSFVALLCIAAIGALAIIQWVTP